ncbi:SgcJ/EcaC family oxidoreductase [Nonomuraea sp. NPDC050556]|uniref:SgcJ/EcaC family oxidoreductase n=1 Tax=Nonomuraea sp. NPDC050556 TaxID=3364369 RepID=UPI00378A1B69
MTDDVGTVVEAVTRAWADNDAVAFAGHYAEEGTAILPGFHLRNRAEIQASMGVAFDGPLKGSRRRHLVRNVRSLGDDTAVVISRSSTLFPGETEPPADRWSMATWVLSRRTGRWLIEAYHDCPAT